MSPSAAKATEPAMRVEGLTVSFGGIVAVDDISFGVKPGEILGVIGPNGAGKTTMFDAICGFVRPDHGRIVLDEQDVTGLTSAQRSRAGLGRSFQDAKLFGSLTVAEILACAMERSIRAQGAISAALGLPWVWIAERHVSRRVDELIELLGLGAFRDKFASELSTGSRRIVDLACVLAHEPSVLLLDEPSSGIAQKETEALGPLLRRVQETTGCTMLLVEHDMPLVTTVSDELIALETGRVIARGSPKQVTNDPRVVEAYLGTDERFVARSGAVKGTGRAKRKGGKRRVQRQPKRKRTARAAKRPTRKAAPTASRRRAKS